jgi:hypothetical protein
MTNSLRVCHQLLLTMQLRRFDQILMIYSVFFGQTEQLWNRLLTDFEFVSSLFSPAAPHCSPIEIRLHWIQLRPPPGRFSVKQVYQLKITLRDTDPAVWRRVLVYADIPLADLHKVVQTAMGWTNSHLHQFAQKNRIYCLPREDDYPDENQFDYSGLRAADLLAETNKTVRYDYDFGDGWEHEIELEKSLPADGTTKYPVCVAGERNCPPEDCGGIPGFAAILEALKDPKSKGAGDTLRWLGGAYDPGYFNIEAVNAGLGSADYGCVTIMDE